MVARTLTSLVVVGLALVAAAPHARATYSVVAVDAATQQIGGAGTSCVGDFSVAIIYGGVPGVGAVHAQARINTAGRDEAVRRLELEEAPADILAAITAPSFDPLAAERQYGIVDLQGRAAAYTGAANGDYAGDVQGQVGAFTYSAQGNILTGPEVIDRAAAAFEGSGCDLAERLMLALEAGAENGGGDSRCTPDGIRADSAFIRVQTADGATILDLEVTGTAPRSAVALLRLELDAWRASNACPGDGGDAGTGGDDAGAGGGGDAGDGGGGGGCRATRDGGGALALVAIASLIARRRRRRDSGNREPPGTPTRHDMSARPRPRHLSQPRAAPFPL